jgi:hypothetical protein
MKGFSKRFTEFLNKIEFSHKSRYTKGAKLVGVSINSFRNWCINDICPRNTSDLVKVISKLDGKKYNSESTAAYIMFGDAVPNPLKKAEEDWKRYINIFAAISSTNVRWFLDYSEEEKSYLLARLFSKYKGDCSFSEVCKSAELLMKLIEEGVINE